MNGTLWNFYIFDISWYVSDIDVTDTVHFNNDVEYLPKGSASENATETINIGANAHGQRTVIEVMN